MPYSSYGEQRALQTRCSDSEIIGGGMHRIVKRRCYTGIIERRVRRKELKRLTFSAGETAIVPSEQKRRGKPALHKLLEILWAKGQKELFVGEVIKGDFFLNT